MKKESNVNIYLVLLFLLIFILGAMIGKILHSRKTSSPQQPKVEDIEIKPRPVIKEEKPEVASVKVPISTKVEDFPETDPEGKYTVQIASFKKMGNAQKFAEQLKNKGYPAFITKALINSKGTWYRVRVGTFKNRNKARKYSKIIKSKEKLKTTYIDFK